MPAAWTWVSLDGLRPVAKTRQSAFWKARARAAPRLSSEQPVMRIVLFWAVIFGVLVQTEYTGCVRTENNEISPESQFYIDFS